MPPNPPAVVATHTPANPYAAAYPPPAPSQPSGMLVFAPHMSEAVALALEMRANYIETGSVLTCKRDILQRAGSTHATVLNALRHISRVEDHQFKLAEDLRALAQQCRP